MSPDPRHPNQPAPAVDRSGCPAPRHGTHAAYITAKCRCPDAREDWRIYRKRGREHRRLPAHVDPTGTGRRLRALAAIGWGLDDLALQLHVTRAAVAAWRDPGRARRVHRATARRVLDVYRDLGMTPGPSARVRAAAARAGWAPPLAWDERRIDDPAATPDHGPARPARSHADVDRVAVERACAGHLDQLGRQLTIAERLQAVRWLAGHGHPDAEIGARVGVTIRTVQRLRAAHRIPAAGPPASRPQRTGVAA